MLSKKRSKKWYSLDFLFWYSCFLFFLQNLAKSFLSSFFISSLFLRKNGDQSSFQCFQCFVRSNFKNSHFPLLCMIQMKICYKEITKISNKNIIHLICLNCSLVAFLRCFLGILKWTSRLRKMVQSVLKNFQKLDQSHFRFL